MRSTGKGLVSALFAAAALAALPAHSQSTGSGNTAREVQRGVPGTDVDINTNANGRARNNGVPGVDVDVRTNANNDRARNSGVPGTDVDVSTRANNRARNNGVPGVDADVNNRNRDTRAMGAAGSAGAGTDNMGQRAARADRN